MHKLKLIREIISNKAVLGRLLMDGKELCKTLENPWLNNQTSISCIPKGEYIAKRYSSLKYPYSWELQNVKDRSKILIHNGNTEKDTEGCILVGERWGFLRDDLAVLASMDALKKLQKELPDEFIIEIKGEKTET